MSVFNPNCPRDKVMRGLLGITLEVAQDTGGSWKWRRGAADTWSLPYPTEAEARDAGIAATRS